MKRDELLKELKAAGAEALEAELLANFGESLSFDKNIERNALVKSQNFEAILARSQKKNGFNWRKLVSIISLTLGGFSLVGASVFAAQNSVPGDMLYPVKRASENIISGVDPNFKNQIPERRSEEVKELVQQKRSEVLIKKSLEDYQEEAKKLNQTSTNIQKAKENLQAAFEKAAGDSRSDIEKVLENGTVEGIHQEQLGKETPTNAKSSEDHSESNLQKEPQNKTNEH